MNLTKTTYETLVICYTEPSRNLISSFKKTGLPSHWVYHWQTTQELQGLVLVWARLEE